MDLYILRHGKAGKRMNNSDEDRLRPLTAKGKKETREIALWLLGLDIEPDWIATSPLTRARETADIVAEELGLADHLIEWEALAIDQTPQAILNQLKEAPDTTGMIVGHEPLLSQTLSLLIGQIDSVRIKLAKGGVAKVSSLTFDPRVSGELEWIVSPEIVIGH
jgi:phosphohistidine phosphatase